MLYSGEEIRQAAAAWEEDAPEVMRTSGYYGFREGCKHMQHMYWDLMMSNPIIRKEIIKMGF